MTKRTDAWFQQAPANKQVDLKMFCFPHAGGSALIFRQWAELLPPTVQVISVELPGRGSRLREPSFLSLPALVNELEEVILPLLDKPFVFFGHSMGAVIAFELTRALRRRHGLVPQALFVAGRAARRFRIPTRSVTTSRMMNSYKSSSSWTERLKRS
jgi:medium-chain acyl-[acyl-carrier-protein] hydrolase